MILRLSRIDTVNLFTSMRKLLPSLLTKGEKESCEKIYQKLIYIIESDFHKSKNAKIK